MTGATALAALSELAKFTNTLRCAPLHAAFGTAPDVANERVVAKLIDRCPDLAVSLIQECAAEALG